MKAFVIKNESGYYFNFDEWDAHLNRAFIAPENIIKGLYRDLQKKKEKDDCEFNIVEITVVEGDLQEINEQLNKNLIEMEQSKLRWENKYFTLEQQLAEKDKEIERLKQENDKLAFALAEEPDKDELLQLKQDFDILYNKTKERDISIRKQVCDEIREKIKKRIIEEDISDWNTDYGDRCWLYALEVDMTKILDQIEQAKESIE